MKRVLFLMAMVPAVATAEPLFGDEFMRECIKGSMDFVFSQSGPVNARDRAKIVRTCLCLQAELNKTVTKADYNALMTGSNADAYYRKDDAAQTKCVLAVHGAPASVPEPRTNYADPGAANAIGADTPRKAK